MPLTQDPHLKMISTVQHDVRSLKKKLAYACNLGPSHKDDEYCWAR